MLALRLVQQVQDPHCSSSVLLVHRPALPIYTGLCLRLCECGGNGLSGERSSCGLVDALAMVAPHIHPVSSTVVGIVPAGSDEPVVQKEAARAAAA
jgi:hypothetical protein